MVSVKSQLNPLALDFVARRRTDFVEATLGRCRWFVQTYADIAGVFTMRPRVSIFAGRNDIQIF